MRPPVERLKGRLGGRLCLRDTRMQAITLASWKGSPERFAEIYGIDVSIVVEALCWIDENRDEVRLDVLADFHDDVRNELEVLLAVGAGYAQKHGITEGAFADAFGEAARDAARSAYQTAKGADRE